MDENMMSLLFEHPEKFAEEYCKHKVFMESTNKHSPTIKRARSIAYLSMAEALKLEDATILPRATRHFRQQCINRTRRYVRLSLVRGGNATDALREAPEWLRRLDAPFDLLNVALRLESLDNGSMFALRQRMTRFTWELYDAVRDAVRSGATARGAVQRHAARLRTPPHALQQLWVRMYEMALSKLHSTAHCGDRAGGARPSPLEWRLIDLALLRDERLAVVGQDSFTNGAEVEAMMLLYKLISEAYRKVDKNRKENIQHSKDAEPSTSNKLPEGHRTEPEDSTESATDNINSVEDSSTNPGPCASAAAQNDDSDQSCSNKASETEPDRLEPPKDPESATDHSGGFLEWKNAEIWTFVHSEYKKRGREASLVLLQKRWHELQHRARARLLLSFRDPLQHPHPLLLALVKRFPQVVTSVLPSWTRLVNDGFVTDDHFERLSPEKPLKKVPADVSMNDVISDLLDWSDDEPEIIETDKDAEVIEIQSDSDTESEKETKFEIKPFANNCKKEIADENTDIADDTTVLNKLDPNKAKIRIIFEDESDLEELEKFQEQESENDPNVKANADDLLNKDKKHSILVKKEVTAEEQSAHSDDVPTVKLESSERRPSYTETGQNIKKVLKKTLIDNYYKIIARDGFKGSMNNVTQKNKDGKSAENFDDTANEFSDDIVNEFSEFSNDESVEFRADTKNEFSDDEMSISLLKRTANGMEDVVGSIPGSDDKLLKISRVVITPIDYLEDWIKRQRNGVLNCRYFSVKKLTAHVQVTDKQLGACRRYNPPIVHRTRLPTTHRTVVSQWAGNGIATQTNDELNSIPLGNKTIRKRLTKRLRLSRTYLSAKFWCDERNVELLSCCQPVTVSLEAFTLRAVKKVELADIAEVRRINRGILTAQVAPLRPAAASDYVDVTGVDPAPASVRIAAEVAPSAAPAMPNEEDLMRMIKNLAHPSMKALKEAPRTAPDPAEEQRLQRSQRLHYKQLDNALRDIVRALGDENSPQNTKKARKIYKKKILEPEEPLLDAYEEWQRQKNINNMYFSIPAIRRMDDTNKDHKKPATRKQETENKANIASDVTTKTTLGKQDLMNVSADDADESNSRVYEERQRPETLNEKRLYTPKIAPKIISKNNKKRKKLTKRLKKKAQTGKTNTANIISTKPSQSKHNSWNICHEQPTLDPYDEWQRQKTLNNKYFNIPRCIPKIVDQNNEEHKKPKTHQKKKPQTKKTETKGSDSSDVTTKRTQDLMCISDEEDSLIICEENLQTKKPETEGNNHSILTTKPMQDLINISDEENSLIICEDIKRESDLEDTVKDDTNNTDPTQMSLLKRYAENSAEESNKRRKLESYDIINGIVVKRDPDGGKVIEMQKNITKKVPSKSPTDVKRTENALEQPAVTIAYADSVPGLSNHDITSNVVYVVKAKHKSDAPTTPTDENSVTPPATTDSSNKSWPKYYVIQSRNQGIHGNSSFKVSSGPSVRSLLPVVTSTNEKSLEATKVSPDSSSKPVYSKILPKPAIKSPTKPIVIKNTQKIYPKPNAPIPNLVPINEICPRIVSVTSLGGTNKNVAINTVTPETATNNIISIDTGKIQLPANETFLPLEINKEEILSKSLEKSWRKVESISSSKGMLCLEVGPLTTIPASALLEPSNINIKPQNEPCIVDVTSLAPESNGPVVGTEITAEQSNINTEAGCEPREVGITSLAPENNWDFTPVDDTDKIESDDEETTVEVDVVSVKVEKDDSKAVEIEVPVKMNKLSNATSSLDDRNKNDVSASEPPLAPPLGSGSGKPMKSVPMPIAVNKPWVSEIVQRVETENSGGKVDTSTTDNNVEQLFTGIPLTSEMRNTTERKTSNEAQAPEEVDKDGVCVHDIGSNEIDVREYADQVEDAEEPILKFDFTEPLWYLAGKYLILTDDDIPYKNPTYVTGVTTGTIPPFTALRFPETTENRLILDLGSRKGRDVMVCGCRLEEERCFLCQSIGGKDGREPEFEIYKPKKKKTCNKCGLDPWRKRAHVFRIKQRPYRKIADKPLKFVCIDTAAQALCRACGDGAQFVAAPDALRVNGKAYERLGETPLVYAPVLSAVQSAACCAALAARGAELHVLSAATARRRRALYRAHAQHAPLNAAARALLAKLHREEVDDWYRRRVERVP